MAQVPGIRKLFSGPNGMMLAALASAMIVLVSSAVVGARNADRSLTAGQITGDVGGPAADLPDYSDLVEDGDSEFDLPGSTGGPNPAGGTGGGSTGTGGGSDGTGGSGGGGGAAKPSAPGATRTGVFNDHFEYGLHAPLTLNGAPLNLAEDPVTGIKGYITDINKKGGINGRKIKMFLVDDKYTTAGGRESRDRLVNEVKPFFISGTLGVDQIAIVAKASGEAKIPYMAIGGPEPEWKDMGMYQVGSNYDQYMALLADFICAHGRDYVGEQVRLGTTTLDSPYILPVEKRFVKRLSDSKCVKTPVDGDARGKILKPDQQTTYRGQLIDLQSSYDGEGANLIVALQDPVSTSRQVAELKQFPTYNPKWTFNNFAHDGDVTLTLMGGEWNGVRGVSGGCYYHPSGNPNAYNPALCNQMKTAHEIWANLGPVTYDENAGGCTGGHCDYDYDEESWEVDGQGGSAGYQIVYFFHAAMKATGSDPTREKFVSALSSYDKYSNLITAPISFKGSNNIMKGAFGGVVYEGQSNRKYRQVTSITPGVVDHF